MAMEIGMNAGLTDVNETMRPSLNHGCLDHPGHHPNDAAREFAEYDAVVSLHAVTGKEVRGAIKGLFYVADKEWALQFESNQGAVVFSCCLTHSEGWRCRFLYAHVGQVRATGNAMESGIAYGYPRPEANSSFARWSRSGSRTTSTPVIASACATCTMEA